MGSGGGYKWCASTQRWLDALHKNIHNSLWDRSNINKYCFHVLDAFGKPLKNFTHLFGYVPSNFQSKHTQDILKSTWFCIGITFDPLTYTSTLNMYLKGEQIFTLLQKHLMPLSPLTGRDGGTPRWYSSPGGNVSSSNDKKPKPRPCVNEPCRSVQTLPWSCWPGTACSHFQKFCCCSYVLLAAPREFPGLRCFSIPRNTLL